MTELSKKHCSIPSRRVFLRRASIATGLLLAGGLELLPNGRSYFDFGTIGRVQPRLPTGTWVYLSSGPNPLWLPLDGLVVGSVGVWDGKRAITSGYAVARCAVAKDNFGWYEVRA